MSWCPSDATRASAGWWGPGADLPRRGLRTLLEVLDEEPTAPADILRLCRWMSEYYVAPLGLALRAALPAVLADVSRDYISLRSLDGAGTTTAPADLTARERRVLEALAAAGAPRAVRALRRCARHAFYLARDPEPFGSRAR